MPNRALRDKRASDGEEECLKSLSLSCPFTCHLAERQLVLKGADGTSRS
jgi:hypothetical protein